QAFEHFYAHIPGLKVVAVATPYDAKGLLKSAIRDDNPVLVLESELMYSIKGEVPDEEYLIPIGQADIKRAGDHVTVVTWGQGLPVSLKAAELAAQDGISVEVVDLRTIRPMDEDTVVASVRKTNRAVVVYHGWPNGGVGCDVVARIQELAFDDLDAPVLRVCYEDLPMPYAENLENLIIPSPERALAAIKRVLYK
ncbi:MAG TPA: transketolase C-terminal domain-containing protein, partial [Nannocystis sp.]